MARSFVGYVRGSDLWSKFISYFIVGGVSAVADFALYSLFIYSVGMHYLVAATVSFILATGLNYVLCVAFVFESGGRSRHAEVALVYVVSAVGITVNLAVLAMAVELAGLHLLVAKLAGTGSAFAWNFSSRYFWIFRAAEPALDAALPEMGDVADD